MRKAIVDEFTNQRKKRGLKRRYHGTLSYRLEAQLSKRQRVAKVLHSGRELVASLPDNG